MKPLFIVTGAAVMVSLLVNRKKTWLGLKTGFRMFMNILPSFITILIAVSFFLAFLSKEKLGALLGEKSGLLGYAIAALLGSISLIPGFIAYPLSAVLIKNWVSYPVISVFITTLMMVGLVTLPLEKKYFGWKVAIARNAFSLAGALAIGASMSLLWGIL